MNIPFVDLHKQYISIKEEIDQAIQQVIEKSAFVGNLHNQFVKDFEASFAEYMGLKDCIACGNGTDSIEILLKASGIGDGDEVLVPAISWIATSEAVSNVGATPVFVDIEPDFFCLDPTLIEEKITERTRCVIPVHLYGHPANMGDIIRVAEQNNLMVIEDCAQAHGAEIAGQKVGTFGTAASFSFFPAKNLGAFGDAGGMVTNNDEISRKARLIAHHGQSEEKHNHLIEGRNSRMDGLNAAVLTVKLKFLEQWINERNNVALKYLRLLKDIPDIQLPKKAPHCRHAYHLFVIRTKDRDGLGNFLKENKISTGIQYPKALPLVTAYKHLRYTKEDFPVAGRIQDEVISLPLFPELTNDEINYVSEKIHSFFLK